MKKNFNYFRWCNKKTPHRDCKIHCTVTQIEATNSDELLAQINTCKTKNNAPIVKIIAAVVFMD